MALKLSIVEIVATHLGFLPRHEGAFHNVLREFQAMNYIKMIIDYCQVVESDSTPDCDAEMYVFDL